MGSAGARQEIISVQPAEARKAGEIVVDEGDGHERIVAFLEQLKVILGRPRTDVREAHELMALDKIWVVVDQQR